MAKDQTTLGPAITRFRFTDPSWKLSTFKGTVRGIAAIGVAGVSSKYGVKQRLAGHAKGTPLPIEGISRLDHCSGAFCVISDAVFSKWNESVHVTAPADAVPIATVLAG